MWARNVVFVLFSMTLSSTSAVWQCSTSEECSSLQGSVCSDGECACPPGKQATLGGSLCSDVAPYYSSRCSDDFQCAGLFTGYTCLKNGDDSEGICRCKPDHHYLAGRCWRSIDFNQPCSRDEECMNVLRDPYSMSCDGVCGCAQGYYLRQRGECRAIGAEIGAGCVLDEDCQFTNGACDLSTFTCYDTTAETRALPPVTVNTTLSKMANHKMADSKMARQHGVVCGGNDGCAAPFICSSFGICVCPRGFYASDDGSLCFADLGTPATELAQCPGMFATIREGRCNCQPNIYYDENMRDCVKATLRLTDSCLSDSMCHTFGGAAQCAPAEEPWGLRACRCRAGVAVWSPERRLCRLFAGIGEMCEVDSDCLAGDLEIFCRADDEGVRRCACPEGLVAEGGLCLNLGLELGATCQATVECSGKTEHSVCDDGVCSCSTGYQQGGDLCLPEIGTACALDSDCSIVNSECVISEVSVATCQCRPGYVAADGSCWTESLGYNATCELTAQCSLGDGSLCNDGVCVCADTHHYRDGKCNYRTGLLEQCSRSSECYLGDVTERVVCRNSLCQCDFQYPYMEEERTCGSGSAIVFSKAMLIFTVISYLILS